MLKQLISMQEKRMNVIQSPKTIKHIYSSYKENIREGSKYDIDYKLYRTICETFNKYMMSSIIDDGKTFKVPYRIGSIRIKKNEINLDNLKYDYKLFKDSDGELKNVHTNEHTNNYYVRFYWSKNIDSLVKNKTVYCFIPTRHNKRYMASLLKENGMNQMNKYFS